MGERKLPGERILERLEARTRRRPRLGFVPEFYARLGVEDPWAPEGATDEGMVFLSAAPFWQTMRRLALSRRRRERATDRFLRKRAGTALRVASRRLPGEAPVGFAAPWGTRGLVDADMRLFVPPAQVATPEGAAAGETPTLGGSRIRTVKDAWYTGGPYQPARVARPMDRAGERLREATIARRVDDAMAVTASTLSARSARSLTRTLMVDEEAVTVRRVVRRRVAPVVREVVEEAALTPMRPTRRVAARADGKAGARTMVSSSPSLAIAAAPAVHHAMAMAQSVPQRLAANLPAEGSRVERPVRSRGRERASAPARTLSASPLAAAAAVAPARPSTSRSPEHPARASERVAARLVALGAPEAELEVEGFAAQALARALPRRSRSSVPTFSAPSATMTLPARVRDVAPEPTVRSAATAVDQTGAYVPARVARQAALVAGSPARVAAPSASTFSAARVGRTPSSPFAGARAGTTAASPFTGAGTSRTAATPFRGAPAFGPEDELPWETARRAPVTASTFVPARRARTGSVGWEAATVALGADTDFVGAATAHTPASQWASARLGGARSGSVLPTSTPLSGDFVLPRHSQPVRTERTVQVEPETPSVPFTGARAVRTEGTAFLAARTFRTARAAGRPAAVAPPAENATVAASARAFRTPTLSTVAARVFGGSEPAVASARGPLAHAHAASSSATFTRTPAFQYARNAAAPGRPSGVIERVVDAAVAESGPMGAFRTPDGRYVSARTARTLASQWAGARRGTTNPTPFAGARSGTSAAGGFAGARSGRTPELEFARAGLFRTPEGDWVPASTASSGNTPFTGARSDRSRPTDWAGARVGVGDSGTFRGALAGRTAATAFAGATLLRTPEGTFDPAGRFVSRGTAWAGATLGGGADTPFVGARRGAPGTFVPPEMELPERTFGAAPAPGARRSRAALDATLDAVREGGAPEGAPAWAARSTGTPRVHGMDQVVDALARAGTAGEVVRVLFERAEGLRSSGALSEPVREVLTQIQREVVQVPVQSPTLVNQRPMSVESPAVTVLKRPSAPVRSTVRRVRGFGGPTASTAKTAGGASDRLSRLVDRLNELVHLAENQQLAEARRQVRLAEDTAQARAEGSAPAGGSAASTHDNEKIDLDALSREVVHEVLKALEHNRERHAEDADESNWW